MTFARGQATLYLASDSGLLSDSVYSNIIGLMLFILLPKPYLRVATNSYEFVSNIGVVGWLVQPSFEFGLL